MPNWVDRIAGIAKNASHGQKMNIPAKTSGHAIASLVFGILSMTCVWILGSIPAIILGIIAIRRIDGSGGTLKGRGLGIAGIVTGGAGVFVGLVPLAIVAAIAVPSFAKVGESAVETAHTVQLKQVLLACKAYAADHDGSFPPDLETLMRSGNLDDETLLYWRTAADRQANARGSALLYRLGLSDQSFSGEPLIAAPVAVSGQRLVGRVGGSVEKIPEWEYQDQYAIFFR